MPRQTPSFTGLAAASAASSKAKQKNKSVDTEHERLLRQALWRMGLRFRKNVSDLPGKPDIVFPGPRVVVFCDGDFWHGRKWETLKVKLGQGHNSGYWPEKIKKNMERDVRNTQALEASGWRVVRLWETDIKRDPEAAAALVKRIIEDNQTRSATKLTTC